MRRSRLSCLIGLLAFAFAGANTAHAEMPADRPLTNLQTINALIEQHKGDEFHIVLVHGIRTSDRNTWEGFRSKLCAHLAAPHRCIGTGPVEPITEKLLLQIDRPPADFLGHPIWDSPEKWQGSQPFVDHYVYALEDGTRLVLDEVNWWPLALALKCQFLVGDDTDLAGVNKDNINNCTALDAFHFGWFDRTGADRLLAAQPTSGGAPLINRGLKTDILDWGISDAVLSLGTMKSLLRETIRCSFDDILLPQRRVHPSGDRSVGAYECEKAAPETADTRGDHKSFVIVSHSLGAFLLLDTFAAAAADAAYSGQAGEPCRDLVVRSATKLPSQEPSSGAATRSRQFDQSLCVALSASSNLYFLANQFSLLELGRAQGLEGGGEKSAGADALSLWAKSQDSRSPRQVVAFSDPGDLLTFKVPQIGAAQVYNAYPHNDFRWFGLFEWPSTAHTNYLTNDQVLKVMFGR